MTFFFKGNKQVKVLKLFEVYQFVFESHTAGISKTSPEKAISFSK